MISTPEKLRAWRKSMDFTPTQAAAFLDVSLSAYNSYEGPQRQPAAGKPVPKHLLRWFNATQGVKTSTDSLVSQEYRWLVYKIKCSKHWALHQVAKLPDGDDPVLWVEKWTQRVYDQYIVGLDAELVGVYDSWPEAEQVLDQAANAAYTKIAAATDPVP